MKYLHVGNSAPTRGSSKHPGGFTTVELVVSIAIFMLVATFVTVIIARSLGEGARIQQARAASQAASDSLSAVMTNSFAAISDGTFTVPYACTNDASASCVTRSGGREIRVAYRYTDAQGQCPVPNSDNTLPANVAPDLSAEVSSVGVCAFPMNKDGEVNTDAIVAKEFKNAPWAGYTSANESLIRVEFTGSAAPAWENSSVYLVRQSDTSLQQASAQVVDAVAEFFVDANTVCTSAQPCQVAAQVSSTDPSRKGNLALFGADARPGANIVSAAGEIVQASVSAQPAATASVRVVNAAAQPAPSGVRVFGYLAQDPSTDAPATTDASGVASFSTYTIAGATYPLAPGDEVVVAVDPVAGVCESSCTSWLWGTANDTLPVRASAGAAAVDLAFDATSPASVSNWGAPRANQVCAPGACSPSLVNPEDELCPGENCLAAP